MSSFGTEYDLKHGLSVGVGDVSRLRRSGAFEDRLSIIG